MCLGDDKQKNESAADNWRVLVINRAGLISFVYTVKGWSAGRVTLRLVLATGLLQPLYRFSSLARRTHKAEKKDERDFFFLAP